MCVSICSLPICKGWNSALLLSRFILRNKTRGFSTDQFLVSRLLQGLKRTNHTQDSRLPITKHLLQRIITTLPSVCKVNYESSLFSLVSSIAFYGLLRVSEFTVTLNQNHRVLLREHLQVDHMNKHLHLLVKFTKLTKLGKGQDRIYKALVSWLVFLQCYKIFIISIKNQRSAILLSFGFISH